MENNKKSSLIEDQMVQKVVPNVGSIPNTDVAAGYLGRDECPGYWRIYMTQDLSEFMIIKEEDILHSQLIEKENSHVGIEYRVFWLNADAKIRYDSTRTSEDCSDLLTGEILKKYVSGFESSEINAPYRMGPVFNKDYTKGFWCSVSMLFSCATHIVRSRVCTIASGKLCGTRRLL